MISSKYRSAAIWLFLFSVLLIFEIDQAEAKADHRPFSARDGIESWDFSARIENGESIRGLTCAPNGSRCLYIVNRGNLASGMTETRIVSLGMDELARFVNGQSPDQPFPGRIAAEFSTSRAWDSLTGLRWLSDDRVVFVASRGDRPRQVFRLDIGQGILEQLTDSSTDVWEFSTSADANSVAYAANARTARRPGEPIVARNVAQAGGRTNSDAFAPVDYHFSTGAGSVQVAGIINRRPRLGPISMSPNGRWIVVGHVMDELPVAWRAYPDVAQRLPAWAAEVIPGDRVIRPSSSVGYFPIPWLQLELVDTHSGASRPLLNAMSLAPQISWSPSSSRVFVIARNLLPDCSVRSSCPASAAGSAGTAMNGYVIEPGRGTVTKIISDVPRRVGGLRWSDNDRLVWSGPAGGAVRFFEDGRFVADHDLHPDPVARPRRILFSIRENVDLPPNLEARDTDSGASRLVTDLNPQLGSLVLNRIESISWAAPFGPLRAQVIFPNGYRQGERYPISILHYDGGLGASFSRGMGQELASRGFLVVFPISCGAGDAGAIPPANANADDWEEVSNAQLARRCYDATIDHVVRVANGDPRRIAIAGFSNTGRKVLEFLALTERPIAAAAITDSVSNSVGSYTHLVGAGSGMSEADSPELSSRGNLLEIGVVPAGRHWAEWLERTAFFALDRVTTPIRFEYHDTTQLANFDTYGLMRRLNIPAEYIAIPDEAHWPTTALGSLSFREGVADWFDYWVNGRQRADPGAGEQYERWARMRRQWGRSSSDAKPPRLRWSSRPR